MVDRQLTIGPATYNYKVFVPANWTKKKKWPVILFLHGGGERGDDNTAQARVGIGPVIEKMKAELNAVVVLPQCPRARWWSEPEMQALALQAFDAASAEFKGDRLRSYLTGLSMGGYGTWSIVKSQPGKFAALAVVCGGAPPAYPLHPALHLKTRTLIRTRRSQIRSARRRSGCFTARLTRSFRRVSLARW
jgi:predicted peptidase